MWLLIMAVVSLTRLRLRSWRFLPGFLLNSWASTRQLRRAPGFLGGLLATEGSLVFWTFTVWRDDNAIHAFREADAHRRAMPKLLEWCDEASVARFQQDGPDLPNCAVALTRMVSSGRISKVRYPSADHALGKIAPARREPQPGLRLRPKTG